ncbi:MAG: oxygen-independent coproporphyrinogen III oxidase-like protein [Zoogloeaceae bacterium]|nr:oxygen-independent coproporphyrinogen III oxidase-like protein [Zoogloeaceae bacterium]MCW5616453.1 oxygen-independent coproporphyrinogen III oxidase-like protein [Rhodocyclaceae bacterium]
MNERRVIPLVSAQPRAASTTIELAAPPPLSLYVHYPWCVRKCPYCDFNSHAVRDEGIPEEAYVEALIADLEAALPQIWGRRINTVFIGGGTPSLLSPAGLDRLLTAVRTLTMLAPAAEITLEANPGTVEAARFKGFREAGVTRVSLGIQSFNDTHLKALGRIHDASEARAAVDHALTHFESVNLDLMYALPGQSLADARADLEAAIGFGPAHLSCYHLTLEPNTPFHAAPPALPDDDLAADMQEMIEARLGEAGYRHYETSAFARPGRECRHNLNYWHFGDYLGIGAGAHGKLSSHTGIAREMRHKHPTAYLAGAARGDFVQDRRLVDVEDLPFEFMMNALRLTGGFALAQFGAHTGLPLAAVEERLIEARKAGFIEIVDERVVPTARGRRFLNELLQGFLPD